MSDFRDGAIEALTLGRQVERYQAEVQLKRLLDYLDGRWIPGPEDAHPPDLADASELIAALRGDDSDLPSHTIPVPRGRGCTCAKPGEIDPACYDHGLCQGCGHKWLWHQGWGCSVVRGSHHCRCEVWGKRNNGADARDTDDPSP